MAVSVFIIAVVSYGLSLVDVCGLVCRLLFKEEPAGRADYYTLYRRYRWKGVGYALAGDLLRALISVLIGGALMKAAGFPSVGKLLALMFALLGQALPLLPAKDRMVPRQGMIFPGLLLLLVDWRVFLIAAVVAVILLALTGNRALMALGAAVMIPVGGNYITLTNLSPREQQRILDLRISPINVSVQATDPEVRRRLLGNPRAGDCYMSSRMPAAWLLPAPDCPVISTNSFIVS